MSKEILDNQGSGVASWTRPPIHPEGQKFGAIAAAITAFAFLMGWELLAWPLVGITIWVFAFFRDPERATIRDDDYIIAPADGLVTLITQMPPPRALAGDDGLPDIPVWRVSIFMSVFDVHINRAPIGGVIKRVVYIPGKFLNADLDKASEENERQHILIERDDGLKIGMTHIAGLVARRIVPFVKRDDIVAVGQRVGLIRFGSRVDVYLPVDTKPNIIKGQRIVAGETILAVKGEQKLLEGVAH